MVVIAITKTKLCVALDVLQGHEGRVSRLVRTGHGVSEVGGEVEEGQHRRFAPHAARLDAVSHSEVINGDNLTEGLGFSALSLIRFVLIGKFPLLPGLAHDATVTVATGREMSEIVTVRPLRWGFLARVMVVRAMVGT